MIKKIKTQKAKGKIFFRSYFVNLNFCLLALIILIGAFLRLQGVFTNSFAFTYDVGRDMLELWNIVYIHKIPLIGATTGLPGIFYGPWWYYMLAPFFIIFRANPQGIAFTMSLVGILSIFLAYVFGKRLSGEFLGLSFAALVSVSPVTVSLAAQIWNPNIIPLFILLVFFVLLNIYNPKDKRLRNYLFLGLLLALIADFEIVFGLLFSISILISVIVIARKKILILPVAYFVAGALFILLPRIVFELRHGFLMTHSFLKFLSSGSSSGNFSSLPSVLLNRFGIIFFEFSSTVALDNKFLGIVILVFIFCATVFLFRKTDKKIMNFIKTSVIVLVVFLIGTAFFSHDIWPHYLVGLPVFYIFLFVVSLYLFGKMIKSNILPIVVVAVLFVISLNPVSVYKSLTSPIWVGNAAVYRNQLAVIDYVYKEAKGRNFKYVVYTPPVYDYAYRYLFLWYGPNKYHYSPFVKSNLAFFILEPDTQYPQRLANWLEQRSGDGKTIKSERLPSGIIVQMRVH